MQSFDVVPDLKESVVGAIRGSKVRSDFTELPQSMSGSPVVNERGEVSLLASASEPDLKIDVPFTP